MLHKDQVAFILSKAKLRNRVKISGEVFVFVDGWVNSKVFTTPEIGGTTGLDRKRELQKHYEIERLTASQYRRVYGTCTATTSWYRMANKRDARRILKALRSVYGKNLSLL